MGFYSDWNSQCLRAPVHCVWRPKQMVIINADEYASKHKHELGTYQLLRKVHWKVETARDDN